MFIYTQNALEELAYDVQVSRKYIAMHYTHSHVLTHALTQCTLPHTHTFTHLFSMVSL